MAIKLYNETYLNALLFRYHAHYIQQNLPSR